MDFNLQMQETWWESNSGCKYTDQTVSNISHLVTLLAINRRWSTEGSSWDLTATNQENSSIFYLADAGCAQPSFTSVYELDNPHGLILKPITTYPRLGGEQSRWSWSSPQTTELD